MNKLIQDLMTICKIAVGIALGALIVMFFPLLLFVILGAFFLVFFFVPFLLIMLGMTLFFLFMLLIDSFGFSRVNKDPRMFDNVREVCPFLTRANVRLSTLVVVILLIILYLLRYRLKEMCDKTKNRCAKYMDWKLCRMGILEIIMIFLGIIIVIPFFRDSISCNFRKYCDLGDGKSAFHYARHISGIKIVAILTTVYIIYRIIKKKISKE